MPQKKSTAPKPQQVADSTVNPENKDAVPAKRRVSGKPPASGQASASEGAPKGARPPRAKSAARKPAAPKTPRTPRARKPAEKILKSAKAAEDSPASEAARPKPARLSIFMVTPEAHPFAKTGGLAEVAAALPDALARLGHDVTVVMPRYRGIDVSSSDDRLSTTITLGLLTRDVTFHARRVREGVTFVFVDAPELFDRDGLYNSGGQDYPDNDWRFAFFSRAALEYARIRGERPSVIHAHDWQTGLVPVYQKMLFSNDPVIGGVPAVFTIHNIAFQGVYAAATLPFIGLGWEVLHMEALEYWGQISYLKGGINFSEKITTVSPTYAREILTDEFGFGMQGPLRRRGNDLRGILNGIDVERWNPENDPFVPASFSATALPAKTAARQALLDAAGLPSDADAVRRPIIGIISRLTYQKGFDLFAAASDELVGLDAAWVMLGSGDRQYEDMWRRLAAAHPRRISATIGFDERLAHLIEAGADMFLMPSRYEPCGLNQMYSLRYGTVPVVHATGGLEDTVQDVSEGLEKATGFKFRRFTREDLVHAVRRALDSFGSREWGTIQQNGMRRDFSWDASAREYVKVYEGR